MSDQKEVTVEVTPEDMEFRARAKAAGLPDVLISVYGTALKRLVADEREACAKELETIAQQIPDEQRNGFVYKTVIECVAIIRARGQA